MRGECRSAVRSLANTTQEQGRHPRVKSRDCLFPVRNKGRHGERTKQMLTGSVADSTVSA